MLRIAGCMSLMVHSHQLSTVSNIHNFDVLSLMPLCSEYGRGYICGPYT
jgi:hypothetical protein